LNGDVNKNYFSGFVIQYVTLFYELPLERLNARTILNNRDFRKKEVRNPVGDNTKRGEKIAPKVDDLRLKETI